MLKKFHLHGHIIGLRPHSNTYYTTNYYLAVGQLLESLFSLTWFKEFHKSSDSRWRQHKPGHGSKWCKYSSQFISCGVKGKIFHNYDSLTSFSRGLVTKEGIILTTFLE